MTNNETLRQKAVKALEAGLLFPNERDFIESLKSYNKKRLSNLSRAQYDWLKAIVKKHPLD